MVSILALSFHPAFYPPKSGGELRLYNIYNNLSKKFAVNMITFTYQNSDGSIEIINHNDNFQEIRIPKTRLSMILHYLIGNFTDIKECSAIITSIESRFNKIFKSLLRDEFEKADVIIFISPYLFTVSRNILADKKVVYESYNVEYDLMKQTLSGSRPGKILLHYVRNIERSLSKRCDIAFAISEDDKNKLINFYNIQGYKIQISPNGVNPQEYDNFLKSGVLNKNRNSIDKCIFLGSFHTPNIEAIENIINIATKLPDVQFIIAGGAADFFLTNRFSTELDLKSHGSYIPKSKILISGVFGAEYWNGIPARWCKPHFEICIPEYIDSLDLRIFSPTEQDIKIESESDVQYKNVNENANYITLDTREKHPKLLSFTCSKSIEDDRGTLGLALQEVAYYSHGEKHYLDIAENISPPYISKQAKNVLLFGQISDEEKMMLYSYSNIALNPMISGSGTNIKMLDYMAAKLPVITTPVGARGLDIENYTHALICDISEFPEKIHELLSDDILFSRLKDNGYRLVCEKYDWRIIAENMSEIIQRMMT